MMNSALFNDRVAAMSVDEIAALNPRVRAMRDTQNAILWAGRGANPLPRPPGAKSGHCRKLSKAEKTAIPAMVGALRDYQTASRFTNNAFTRRFPQLGNASGWRSRLVRWQPQNFHHGRWYLRLRSVCETLDAEEPQWREKIPGELHPLSEFAALVQKFLDHARDEEWSQRQLCQRVGFPSRTWRRIRDGEAPFLLNIAEWLPKLRSAAARLHSGISHE